MSHKSLIEAAAEVLNKSRASTYREPMHKEPTQPAETGEVNVGGATLENPQGPAVGQITAAARSQTEKPGVQPPSDSKEPMKKLPTQPQEVEGRPTVDPDELNGSQAHDYQHPTSEETSEEEVELTEEELAEAKKEKWNKIKEKMKGKKSVKEDIDAILEGQTFSDEFKTKLSTIFEAAVITRAVEVAQELEEEILQSAEETVQDIKEEIESNVDGYLTQMVEEWKAENNLAIETGLKAEIVEEFLSGLKNLFEEHYIELPSEKVDVVEALTAEVDELTEKLNKSINSNVELTKQVNEAKKLEITSQVCEGLTATQAGKIKTLAEGVEFTTAGEYTKKLQIIREGYISNGQVKQEQPVNAIALAESETPAQEEELSPQMAAYIAALTRTQR